MDLWDKQQGRRNPTTPDKPVAPWQGITEIAQAFGINLGALWQTREDELNALKETADAAAKEVHEMRVHEIDQRVQALQTIADKVTLAMQPQQGAQGQPKGFLAQLDELTQGWISNRFTAMLGGGSGQQAPQDPVDTLIAHEEKMGRLRKIFTPSSDGNASALAQSGIKGEILKLILEDERERIKIDKEHEVAVERNKHLGELTSVVKENLSDGIRALTMAAEEARGKGGGTASSQELETYECGTCKTKFTVPKGALEKGQVGCPKCHTIYGPEVKSG